MKFYYDFVDKYLDRRDFELIHMGTDSLYMVILCKLIDEIVRPELLEKYNNCRNVKFLSASKYHNRTPGLFKAEFQGTRMITLMSKCYYTEDFKLKPKFSCKGISKKQNPMSWERYFQALNGSINMAMNTGSRLHEQGIVTYTQDKLGLSVYYDKWIIAPDGIHMEPLR